MAETRGKCDINKKEAVVDDAEKHVENIHFRVGELSEMMKKDGYI